MTGLTGREPSYLRLLESGELERRVIALEALLERCTVCPLDCGNNRLNDEMARAILIAAETGLRLPIVYNTNAYDSVEVVKLLDGLVDVYLPDLKYAEDEAGFLYSKVRSYRDVSRAAIAEMFRQTGDELVFGEDGLLKRGLVIRLLVLPNDIGGVRESLEWIRDELSPRVAVSLMAQYYPTNVAGTNQRYTLLSRRITETEWLRAG